MSAKFHKRVYCMRGLPGMGKSGVAEMLHDAALASGATSIICSNDYYIPMVDGKYIYTDDTKTVAREKCEDSYRQAILVGFADVVIVDNVNYKLWHMDFYKKLAEEFGYSWTEVTVGDLDVERSFKNNSHGCPKEIIAAMARGFERR